MSQMKTITVRFAPQSPGLAYTSYLRNGTVTTTGIVLDTFHSLARGEGVVTLRALSSRGQLASGNLHLSAGAMDELALAWLRLRHDGPGEISPFPNDGCDCPACGSWDVAGDDVSTDAGEAGQEMGCNACGARWVHVYASLGYSDLAREERGIAE